MMNCIRRTAGLDSRESAPPAPPLPILRPLLTLLLMALLPAHGWDRAALVKAGRAQIGVTTGYDPSYRVLAYPGGDVAPQTGVCTDVLIRALRAQGIDLQRRVHEDMRGHFSRYPQRWGLKGPDRNIDHRRVPNLQVYFQRHGQSLAPSRTASDYEAGDIVSWNLADGRPHIGIISDRKAEDGTPLVIHNIGAGVKEENVLWDFKITGHYRPAVKVKKEKKVEKAD